MQVINEADGEIVYTIRINGSSYRSKVFERGSYTIKVGAQETGQIKTLTGLTAGGKDDERRVRVSF